MAAAEQAAAARSMRWVVLPLPSVWLSIRRAGEMQEADEGVLDALQQHFGLAVGYFAE